MSVEKSETEENKSFKKVLDAAVELFASQGMAATTVAQIIESSGVSESCFQQQFGSKETVFEKLIEEFSAYSREQRSNAQFDRTNLKASLLVLAEILTALHRRFPMLFRTMAGRVGVEPAFMVEMRALRVDIEVLAAESFGHLVAPENIEGAREKIRSVTQMMLAILTHSVVFESGPTHYLSSDCSEQLATMAHAALNEGEA